MLFGVDPVHVAVSRERILMSKIVKYKQVYGLKYEFSRVSNPTISAQVRPQSSDACDCAVNVVRVPSASGPCDVSHGAIGERRAAEVAREGHVQEVAVRVPM